MGCGFASVFFLCTQLSFGPCSVGLRPPMGFDTTARSIFCGELLCVSSPYSLIGNIFPFSLFNSFPLLFGFFISHALDS